MYYLGRWSKTGPTGQRLNFLYIKHRHYPWLIVTGAWLGLAVSARRWHLYATRLDALAARPRALASISPSRAGQKLLLHHRAGPTFALAG